MSTNLTDNFLYKGKKPLDDRQLFKTKADMKAFPESALPTLYDAFCEEDGNKYVFNKANEVNEETGKWRVFEGGSGSSVDLSKYQLKEDDTLTTTDKTITGAINELKDEIGDDIPHVISASRQEFSFLTKYKPNSLYLIDNYKCEIIFGSVSVGGTFNRDVGDAKCYLITWPENTNEMQIFLRKINKDSKDKINVYYFGENRPQDGDSVLLTKEIETNAWVTLDRPDSNTYRYVLIEKTYRYNDLYVLDSIKEVEDMGDSQLYLYTKEGWKAVSNFESSRYYSKTEVEELIDNATSTSNGKFLTEDIEVKGIIDGLGYKNGDIISKDITANDFIKTLMRKVIPPTYIKPTYKVTISPSVIEVGKETTFNCVGSFTQNDAGTATTLIVKDYKNTETYNGEYKNSISLTETIPTAGKYNHTFTINYNEGTIKQNNFGENDETGKITAGSINIIKQIEAVYPYYIGVSNTDILDEDKIIKLTKKVEIKGNKTINFSTSQNHMVFAYPKEYGSIKSIIDANGFNVTDSFTITTLSINSIDYYIYISNKCSDKYTMNFNY